MSEKNEGWSWFLLFICIELTVGAVLPCGFYLGVLNGPSKFINTWSHDTVSLKYSKKLDDSQITILMACVASIFQVGGMIGSVTAFKLNTKFGRKKTLSISGLLFIVGGLFQLFCRAASSVELLLLGRLLGGIAAGIVYSTQPMYLVELAPTEISGSVGVFTAIGITGGILVGQFFSFDFILGSDKLWHIALAAHMLFVVVGLTPLYLFPESPHYLVSKGNVEESKAALTRLRSSPERAERELAEIQAAATQDDALGICAVIRNGKLKMPLIIVCSFNWVQQFSGITAIFYYSVQIFSEAGFTTSVAMWLTFAVGALNFFMASLNPLIMAKFNRRPMLHISYLFCGIFLLLFTIALRLMGWHKSIAWACIFFLSMYIVSFNCGVASVPFFIGTGRASAMALGSLCNWLSSFTMAMTLPISQRYFGAYAFIPCALICIFGLLLTYRYLPETKNSEPKDIAILLEHGFKSKIKKEN